MLSKVLGWGLHYRPFNDFEEWLFGSSAEDQGIPGWLQHHWLIFRAVTVAYEFLIQPIEV